MLLYFGPNLFDQKEHIAFILYSIKKIVMRWLFVFDIDIHIKVVISLNLYHIKFI